MDYHFDIEHAKRWGVEEAIFLQNLIYWLRHNKANNKGQKDGRTWSYNTLEAFSQLFPFWTVNQIRRIIASLTKQGVIIKGSYNQRAYDRTCWYALADESLLELSAPICANPQMDLAKPSYGVVQTAAPIPDSKQDQNKEREAQAPQGAVAGAACEPSTISLTPIIAKMKTEAQAQGAPPSFIGKVWSAGILELRRSGVGEGELLEAFRVCLEQAPDRLTFFPGDFLKWRKVSREQIARARHQQHTKQERNAQKREREAERKRMLAEREDSEVCARLEAAIANLPWKRVR